MTTRPARAPARFAPRPALASFALALATALAPAPALANLNIVINPGATLAANASALASFQAAAAEWSSRISTNETVHINADLSNLGNSGILGETDATILTGGYDVVRNALAAHATASPDLAILAALPTSAQFTANLPTGFSLSGNLNLTQASAHALGFTFDSGVDGTITFNNQFNFAYSRGDLNNGNFDFQSIAAHEIGHVLGFISSVDDVDNASSGSVSPMTLDLFRFNAAHLPTNAAEFTSFARELRPGQAADTSDTQRNLAMSTGANHGDGFQASHWKADDLTGVNIGVMDPTIAPGQVYDVTDNDLRAMALIGYTRSDTAVPEPGPLAFSAVIALAVAGNFARNRRTPRRADA